MFNRILGLTTKSNEGRNINHVMREAIQNSQKQKSEDEKKLDQTWKDVCHLFREDVQDQAKELIRVVMSEYPSTDKRFDNFTQLQELLKTKDSDQGVADPTNQITCTIRDGHMHLEILGRQGQVRIAELKIDEIKQLDKPVMLTVAILAMWANDRKNSLEPPDKEQIEAMQSRMAKFIDSNNHDGSARLICFNTIASAIKPSAGIQFVIEYDESAFDLENIYKDIEINCKICMKSEDILSFKFTVLCSELKDALETPRIIKQPYAKK